MSANPRSPRQPAGTRETAGAAGAGVNTGDTGHILRHWRETVPDDRLAHMVRDVARAQMRALQRRLA